MRLIVVSAVIDPEMGGPAMVVARQLAALRALGVEVTLFGVAQQERLGLMRHLYPDAQLFPLTFPKRWFRAKGLISALMAAVPNCDLLHAHMLWDYPVWAAWSVARRFDKPLIITPHGSLMEPWRYRSMHKRIYRRLVVDPMLRERTVLHVLSCHEADASRQAGVLAPLCVVPNGLQADAFYPGSGDQADQLRRQGRARWPLLANGRMLLYLGRLWEGKGVMELLEAWVEVISQPLADSWILVLAGPDYKGFCVLIDAFIEKTGIGERVLLTGGVFGEEKAALLAMADGFVLPSHSEGASMALLEAMASKTPVILTRECHFPELAAAGGGIEVPMGREGVGQGIRQLLVMSPQARIEMGQKGRLLALSHFTMERIGAELLAMYRDAAKK